MKTLGLYAAFIALMIYPLEGETRRCRDGVCRDRGAVRPVRPGRPPARVNPTRPRPPRANPAPTRPRNPRVNPTPSRPRNPGAGYDRDRNPRRDRDWRSDRGDYRRDHDRDWRRDRDHRRDYDRDRRQRRRVRHTPVRVDRRPRVVYRNPYQYYRNYRNHVTLYQNRWFRWSISFNDGLHYLDGRPIYVYNGYRHRYTPVEICDYELVDRYSHTTYRTFYGQTCSAGYDRCAELRDDLNWYEYDDRYFCAERYFDDPYRY